MTDDLGRKPVTAVGGRGVSEQASEGRSTVGLQHPDAIEPFTRAPLQRAIQLLKRHRDVMFADNPEVEPISMILTNLSGRRTTAKGTSI